jgi:flavin reductase (DIM6/NTAB) family NADH-FMN oxidoreductase RutF
VVNYGDMDTTAASTLFAWLDREIWLVTAQAGARRGGLIATFVSQASIVPDLPRMLLGVAKPHHTWELIEASGAFALHLLGEEQLDLVWRFGLESGHEVDKLADLDCQTGITGSPLLESAVGWLDCRVETKLDTGDRTIYLAEVMQGQVRQFGPPLTQKRLVQLAPSDKLSELKRRLQQDSVRDTAAILEWRLNWTRGQGDKGTRGQGDKE